MINWLNNESCNWVLFNSVWQNITHLRWWPEIWLMEAYEWRLRQRERGLNSLWSYRYEVPEALYCARALKSMSLCMNCMRYLLFPENFVTDHLLLLDALPGRFYQVEVDTGQLRGTFRPNVYTETIAVNSEKGILYWSDIIRREIQSSYLNGTDLKTVHSTGATVLLFKGAPTYLACGEQRSRTLCMVAKITYLCDRCSPCYTYHHQYLYNLIEHRVFLRWKVRSLSSPNWLWFRYDEFLSVVEVYSSRYPSSINQIYTFTWRILHCNPISK